MNAGLKQSPHFTTDANGKPTSVTLDTIAYITLLVQANVTDAALWPPGMDEGVSALKRLRQIESDCISHYGEFDWEKLPKSEQDEYDRLCLLLDELQDTGTWVTWEEYKLQHLESRP